MKHLKKFNETIEDTSSNYINIEYKTSGK